MWEAVETSARKIRIGKAEGRRDKEGSREKERRKGKEEEAARSEAEAKKLVPEKFHEWIKVFGKKQLERMPTRKLWDHAIDVKEGFVPRKGKVYPLSREEREEVREFVKEQLRKGYIQPSIGEYRGKGGIVYT